MKYLFIFLTSIFLLFSCNKIENKDIKYPELNNNNSQLIKSPSFIKDGVINITTELDIRNAPTKDSDIIGQSLFGDFFIVWEEKGSGIMENGILDLWYKISGDEEEWINGLYLKRFPFLISGNDRTRCNEKYRKLTVRIDGYREVDGKKELWVDVHSIEYGRDKSWNVYFSPVNYTGIVELQENYIFFPSEYAMEDFSEDVQDKYSINLIDNKFDILRNYSIEIDEIFELYKRFINISNSGVGGQIFIDNKEVYFDENSFFYEDYVIENTWNKKIIINSSDVLLSGINVGSKKDDVLAFFGNDFSYHSDLFENKTFEEIEYYLGYFYKDGHNPTRIIFSLIDEEVVKIMYSLVFTK